MSDNKDKTSGEQRDGNGSSNEQNHTTGDGGEARNGHLSQFKNHSTPGGETLNEYISGEDRYGEEENE